MLRRDDVIEEPLLDQDEIIESRRQRFFDTIGQAATPGVLDADVTVLAPTLVKGAKTVNPSILTLLSGLIVPSALNNVVLRVSIHRVVTRLAVDVMAVGDGLDSA